MAQVDLLQTCSCSTVARLHLAYLHTSFTGKAGRELLTRYYRAVTCQEGACGYVAKKDGRIIGFVCGVWDPGTLRRTLLHREWFGLAWWALMQALVSPRLILDFLSRLKSVPDEADNGYELRPIVVTSAARGKGTATILLDVLLNDAAQRGFEHIYLYTEEDNLAANAFYKKMGFERTGQRIYHGITQLRYGRSVSCKS